MISSGCLNRAKRIEQLKALQPGQFDDFLHSSCEAVEVLSTCRGEVGLTATATLHQACSLAHHLTSIELQIIHQVVAEHHGKEWLLIGCGSNDAEQLFGQCLANLERQVFG